MAKYCLIEIDLGVICACMPSMPVLFRSLNTAIKTRRKGSSVEASGYSGSGAPFATTWNSGKNSAAISSFSHPRRPEVSKADHIQMTTTIDQTYWQDHSEDQIPLQNQQFGGRPPAQPTQAYVNANVWAGSVGHGARAEV